MTCDERKQELFRLSLDTLLKEYMRIKGIPEGSQPPARISVDQLIQTILDAEFPKPK
jgi:hypothetical protein